MASSLIDTLLDSVFDEKWVGKRGEKLTEKELRLVSLFGRKGKTLRNVYIPKENGETSEIDVMYLTQKGIFVFESKNYSGWIFGDEDRQNWTVSLPNKQKIQFYNPIKQNKTHIKWLQAYVGDEVPLFSVIVFSERCELKKITVRSDDVKVIQRDETYATVRKIWDASPDKLPDGKIADLYEALKKLTNVDDAIKAAHIQNIQRKYRGGEQTDRTKPENDPAIPPEATTETAGKANEEETKESSIPASTQETALMQIVPLCPRCGKPLILRTAKKGNNAGKQFYGCSGFPGCRYIMDL